MTNAETIATLLLEIESVTLNLKKPYRYTSGILSPIYCDNRLIISYPEKRNLVIESFLKLIDTNNIEFDVVAGTATAGIPHAAWLADRLNKPMVYVRSNSKKHGKQNQIEGKLAAGQKALVVEDLISAGKSSVTAGLALREAGAVVTDVIAIFTYEMEHAKQHFLDNEMTLHSLSNFSTLMEVATQNNYINSEEKEIALKWNQNPQTWGREMEYE